MGRFMRRYWLLSVSAGALLCSGPAAAATAFSPGLSTAWFNQIHLTSALESQVNGGKGVVIGLVDTGIVANLYEFSGRVSSASSCAAKSFACPSGVVDGDGHGTATAAIAAGAVSLAHSMSMSGVAPMATIVEEKALNDKGSGTTADVANGIVKAVNAGAQVVNLSLTYAPTSDVVSAINYAASRNAIIVFAGGNSSQALNGGANSTGLSAAALSHLVFVGSVNASNTLSSFSNTPGAGVAASPTASVSYASLWLMAPGEQVVAPGIQYGATASAYWTGTSMSAPMVSGALALLEAQWPVLARNGTATAVLLQSSDDLGAKGVDNTYGNGLLDIAKAFQPIGSLTVMQANGHATQVAKSSVIKATGGAVGALSALRTVLSNYTTFDSFSRDFKVNLSSLVAAPRAAGSVADAVAPPMVQAAARFAGGQVFMAESTDAVALARAGQDGSPGFMGGAIGAPQPSTMYLSFQSETGATAAVGRGMTSSFSFAQALWGAAAPAADQAGRLGVSGSLLNLAQGGDFAAGGIPLGAGSRLAFSWSSTPNAAEMGYGPLSASLTPASALAVGFTTRINRRWSIGASYSALGETSALLGAGYESGGLLDLGAHHHSQSISVSSAFDVGGGVSLLAETTRVQTDGAPSGAGLIASVSPLAARAWGVSVVKSDAFRDGDGVSLSFREPLRVVSGSAQVAVTTVDDQGYPTTTLATVGLRPDGVERDLFLGYSTAVGRDVDVSTAVGYRADVENARGMNDVAFRLALGVRF